VRFLAGIFRQTPAARKRNRTNFRRSDLGMRACKAAEISEVIEMGKPKTPQSLQLGSGMAANDIEQVCLSINFPVVAKGHA